MFTVILLCWKRFENFNQIIEAWLNEPEVSEIIIWDNSGKFQYNNAKVKVINSQVNMGNAPKYFIATVAQNEYIINCDDDILPKPGICKTFLRYASRGIILGVGGKVFDGCFSKAKSTSNGKRISNPVEVDLCVGYLTCMHREDLIGLNFKDIANENAELCVAGQKRNLKQLVIPCTEWEQLPESWDENALCLRKDVIPLKEEIYRRYFL